jgi:putative FmdB family regulatory protein
MPTYEYRCPGGHEFERFQKMTDPPRARCPQCGRVAARQISGGAGLIFKGSGFYITDYGKDGKGPRKEPEAEARPEAAKDKEAKPAAAESSKPGPAADKPAKKSSRKKASS